MKESVVLYANGVIINEDGVKPLKTRLPFYKKTIAEVTAVAERLLRQLDDGFAVVIVGDHSRVLGEATDEQVELLVEELDLQNELN